MVEDTTGTANLADAEDLQAELEKLRAENESLKKQADDAPSAEAATHDGWRWTGFVVLLIIGALLLQLAIGVVWLNRTVMDTDRWVETVGPLAEDPAIQTAISDAVSLALFEEVDVEGLVNEVLPEELQILAAPVAGQIEGFVAGLIDDLVRSDQFAEIWREGNRVGHTAFVAVANGDDEGAATLEAGVLAVDTAPILTEVQARFEDTRLAALSEYVPWDEFETTFVLYESPALAQIQSALGWLNRMVWIIPLFALGFLAGAVALAPDRRRGWLWLGVAVVVAAVIPLVSVNVARDAFAANVYSLSGIDTSAGYAFYDIVLRFLINALRTVAMLGIVIAAAAWLSGPARASVALREAISRMVSGVSSGTEFGEFGVWVREHKGLMRLAGVGLAVLVLVLWSTPTPGVIAGLGLFVGIWLILVEFFGRGPDEGAATTAVPEDPRD